MTQHAYADETALVPAPVTDIGSPMPVFNGQHMAAAFTAYKQLQAELDRAMPDQIVGDGDRKFRKKGYWRAVCRAFNLSVELVNESREVHGSLEDGTENYVWTVTYRASTQSGTGIIGDGACAASEKQQGRMKATEHNVRAHAHTRAMNRAISNLVAFGEVSAEEVERDEHPESSGPRPVGNGSTASAQRPPMQAPQRKSGTPISEAQRRRMYAIAKGAGWSDEDYRAHVTSHGFERDDQVTRDVYEAICNEFEAGIGG